MLRPEYFAVSRFRSEICDIKISPKLLFHSTAKHKCCKTLFLEPNREIKMPQKKPLKTHFWKSYFLFFWNSKLRRAFLEARFLFSGRYEKQGEQWKNCLKTGRDGVKTGRFCIRLYMPIFTRGKFTNLSPDIFGWNSRCNYRKIWSFFI